jgi:hypothetical protein
MIARIAGTSLAIGGLVLCGLFAAAQDQKKDSEQKKNDDGKKTGTIIGELKAREDTKDGKNTLIKVLAPGEEKARSYHVMYDDKAKGGIPAVLAAVRAAKIGDRVEFDWLATGHGPMITSFKIFRKADQPPATAKKQLAQEIIGTWALAGTSDKIEEVADAARLKFLTGKHWTVTQNDPKTGKVIFHHGGTYTLDGDVYTESVEYANESTAELIGQKYKFKVKVDGDVFTNIGQGNPWNEAWKRAK